MNTELLKSQIIEYSARNVYLAEKFVVPKCFHCGCGIFTLVINADEGVAARTCTSCNSEQGIADSDDFFDEFYLGCECSKCHDSGVYADWKNEYIGFQELLNRV